MRMMRRLGVYFYVTSNLFFGITLGLLVLGSFCFSLGLFKEQSDLVLKGILGFVSMIYYDGPSRLLISALVVIFLILNYLFFKALSERHVKGSTIAFDNPNGRVSVTIAAIEDLTRRIIAKVPEVKEVKTAVEASKKDLNIEARLSLNTDVNIPGMTSRIQDLVMRKIQDTIGLDIKITVRVNVVKMLPSGGSKVRKNKEIDEEVDQEKEYEPTVPFQGYRV